MPNLKPAPRLKLLDNQSGLLYRNMGLCLSLLCSVLGIACHELSLLLPQSHGTKEHKPLWPPEASDQGVSPGRQLQQPAPGACKAFLWETLVLWSVAEAEHKDLACPLGEDYS